MSKLPLVTEKDTDMADRESTTSIPRWVKVSGVIVIVLLLLYGIMELTGIGGGGHGPGRHIPSSDTVGHTPKGDH